jgi:hypothetical protein
VGIATVTLEAGHRVQAFKNVAWDKCVADGPPEDMPDAVDLLVDVPLGPVHVDYLLLDGLEGQRAEPGGWQGRIQRLRRAQGQTELFEFLVSPIVTGRVNRPGWADENRPFRAKVVITR